MIRALHAADLHLDSPFQGLTRDQALRRRQEQRLLLGRIVDLAMERGADIALLAGDLFDSEDIFSDTGRELARALAAMEIPVFIAPGNHDWYGPRSVWAGLDLPENVHLFRGEEITCFELPALGLRVWGAAFPAAHRSPPLLDFSMEKRPETTDILVLHGEVGPADSPYGAVTPEQLGRSGMDYAAFGHIHSFSGARRAGETVYAWPGCPEGRGFDETGPKGVILADVGPGQCEVRFVPLPGRRYETLTMDLTDVSDVSGAVIAALPPAWEGGVLRLTLVGQTDEPPDLPALRRLLADRLFALQLRDRTVPRRDFWEERHTASLKGLFLTRLWQRCEKTADPAEQEELRRAALWGLAAMENADEPPLPD